MIAAWSAVHTARRVRQGQSPGRAILSLLGRSLLWLAAAGLVALLVVLGLLGLLAESL